MTDLIDLAKKAVEAALKEGAEQVDAFIARYRAIALTIEKGGIKLGDSTFDYGIGVRAFYKGGMGFASTQRLDVESIVKTGVKAARQAKQAEPDPDFVSLPEPRKAVKKVELFDREIAEMTVEKMIELACEMIDAAKVSDDIIVNGDASLSHRKIAIVNSLGVEVEDESTSISFTAFCIVKRGEDVGSYYEYDFGRRLRDVDPVKVGETAGREALKFLGAKKVETKAMPVILHFIPVASLIMSVLNAANAESIQRRRSYLVDKLETKIAPDFLTVYDDGTIDYGVRSSTYDAEGVPKRRILVIENGVLKTYLHNSYTANKAGVEDNACAVRGYRSSVWISPSNVQIKPGDWSLDEMIEETREGVLIKNGWLGPDPVTGDISTAIDFGYKIENGEIAYPLKGTLIGGNILEMLLNIDAISKEYRKEPGNIYPAFRIKTAKIAGGR